MGIPDAFFVGTFKMYKCANCGAVIADEEKHKEWHQNFVRLAEVLGRIR